MDDPLFLRQRIEKLEELQSFADHRSDQLGEQMAAMEQRLGELELKLRRVEEGLGPVDERTAQPPRQTELNPLDPW